ncbi:hypothetical protein QBC46DRAFT_366402 [Diplogelasinospora grovesii]|uniref:SUZ domain-containing protein n=1 Tax=Diplogelasinospora grovesii TaxID=303347 RepID=A0AAN6N2T2_9PEZI|nr:hypothetical protein QBC46DRAFT_366402 [Diplogelasinospora grovesii]
MGKNNKVPDAWDDDWEAQADRAAKDEQKQPEEEQEASATMTRAERLAKHAEMQRKLWESAEQPEDINFIAVASSTIPPLATPAAFKPAVKLLSRKPAPRVIAKKDPVTGLESLTIQDDDEEVDETKNQPSIEEIRQRQQREREEKQRRYDEARAKIFGTESKSNPSSGQSTPGTVTPPASSEGRQQNYHRGGRGRGRGGRGGGVAKTTDKMVRQVSSGTTRELYDPNHSPKPGFNIQKRAGDGSPARSGSTTPREEDQIIRAPRGPDGSGRGGFGFARRGGVKEG